jgi:hypothetical protein
VFNEILIILSIKTRKAIKIVLMKNIYFIFLFSTAMLAACNDMPSDEASQTSPPANLTVTPGEYQITVLSPSTDGAAIGRYSVVSGHCGRPKHPIEVVGDGKTVLSICQNDYTWASPVSATSISSGVIQYQVSLKDLNIQNGSPAVLRSMIKADDFCSSEENKGRLYANSADGGNGTTHPYVICTPTQFSNIRFNPNAKFALGQNVNFAMNTISPIAVQFTGELDGRGYSLEDFLIKDVAGTGVSVGLFRHTNGATFKNLEFRNANVDGTTRVGIIAGDMRGSAIIDNVKMDATIKGITMCGAIAGLGNGSSNIQITNSNIKASVTCNSYSGGAIGFINTNNGGTLITNSNFYTDVVGLDHVGGIIGMSSEPNTQFTNVLHKGDITSQGFSVGGLIGEAAQGQFTNVRNIGSVSSTKDNIDVYVGGLVGHLKGISQINQSNSTSNVSSGGKYTGGLVGRFNQGTITDSYVRGSIFVNDDYYNSPQMFVGGLLGGTNFQTLINSSYSLAEIDAKAYYVGGLVGNLNGATSVIHKSYTTGIIKAQVSNVGGLVGNFNGSAITESFSRSRIEISNPTPNAYIGGLVGFTNVEGANFVRVYSSGDIAIMNNTADNVGGLFGYVRANSIKEAFFSGTVSGARSRVGGIAGYLSAQLSQSFVDSSLIEGSLRDIGGIAGTQFQASITDVFSKVGVLSGSNAVGGITGALYNASTTDSIARSYFMGQINKSPSSVFDDIGFGATVGIAENANLMQNNFYLNSSVFTDLSDSSPIAINGIGTSYSDGQLRNQSSYINFNFTQSPTTVSWQMPSVGFKLPFRSTDHLYAIPNWALSANYGFNLPTIFSDDPLSEEAPEIFNSLRTILGGFSEEEFNAISSNTPVATVTLGQLQVSIISPATDGEPISTQRIIHGECGIAGGKISITGDFIVNTICQSNNRWATIVDASQKPTGNLSINIKISNLLQTQQSNQVSRILVKSNSLCSSPQAIKATFANSHIGGNGGSVPYKICHAGHFRNIAFYPALNYELADDIDFAGNTLDPIRTAFRGNLDGKNFKLKNININKPSNINVALFEALQDATVRNLIFDKFNIIGYDRVGVLAGSWRGVGTVENVHFRNGSVKGIQSTGTLAGLANSASTLNLNNLSTESINVNGNNFTGGLVGYISTTEGSFTANNINIHGVVNGFNQVGGLVGYNLESDTTVTNTTFNGVVSSFGTKVGGLFGHIKGGTFSSLNVTGEVNSTRDGEAVWLGGVIGHADGITNLNNIQFHGTIDSGGDNVGGIVGTALQGTFTNLLTSGSINHKDDRYNSVRVHVGGLIGQVIDDTQLTLSSSSMVLNTQARYVGGLVGYFAGKNSVVRNCFSTGNVNAYTSFVGGLIGIFDGPTLWDSWSSSQITITQATPNANLGGLVGYANNNNAPSGSDYQRLYARGNITISSGLADYVGGLVGFFRKGSLVDSYATGNISGARNASGGLVGIMRGDIARSYAAGNVSGVLRHLGGLVGYQLNGSITDSYALGDVSANEISGGLVGYVNAPAGVIQRVYAFGSTLKNSGSTGSDESFGSIYGAELNIGSVVINSSFNLAANLTAGHTQNGIALDAEASTNMNSYGFDFDQVWNAGAGISIPGFEGDYSYPVLSWQGGSDPALEYSITGTITGLAHSSISLTLNSAETIIINSAETSFSFATKLIPGQSYSVSISSQPQSPQINCNLISGSGIMGNANVTNISVQCPTFQSIALNAQSAQAVASAQPVTITGTLSNSVQVDLTSFANLTATPGAFQLVESNLVAISAGTTTISAQWFSLSVQKTVTAFTAPNAPTNLAWNTQSPSLVPQITALWTPSTSSNIVSQSISYYLSGVCQGAPITTKQLSVGLNSDSFTGTDASTYSFRVSALDSNNLTTTSACSSSMRVELPDPNPIANLTVSNLWVTGAIPVSSSVYSWSNPTSISGIQVSMGTAPGLQNIVAWSPVGLVSSFGFSGLSTLVECAPYYASVRTMNSFGKFSSVQTHSALRWDNTDPQAPGAISFSGIATASATPSISWIAAVDNCEVSHYEMAIGSSPGDIDVADFHAIGSSTSYQAISGANNTTFELTQGVNYYVSIRAVDRVGKISPITTSEAFQLPSTGFDEIMWLDASERVSLRDRGGLTPDDPGFSGRIAQWLDRSPTGLIDAYSPNVANDPDFHSNISNLFFNGLAYYLRLPSSAAFDNSTFVFKNQFVSFKSSTDVINRQTIFEWGNRNGGMNLYIDSGKLYCGFWHTQNSGDGVQAFIHQEMPVNANTTYHVALVLDYTNYAGANGPDGAFRCFVNGSQWGSDLPTTTRLYAKRNSAALGATYSGTRYHNANTNSTGDFFFGNILEARSYNSHTTNPTVLSVLGSLMSKWSRAELSAPGNITLSNNSTLTQAATLSWTGLNSPSFITDHYELAIGTSSGGTEISFWTDIGLVNTYTATDLIDGFNFDLNYGVEYFLSVRAVDANGNLSQAATSASWRVVNPAKLLLPNTFLHLDGRNLASVIDGSNNNAHSENFLGLVARWQNNLADVTLDFTQNTNNARPQYFANMNSLSFIDGNKRLQASSNLSLNNSTQSEKAITTVIASGGNITSRQFIYEMGSRNGRGMSIYIFAGELYCLFHANSNGGDGAQVPLWVSTPIEANTEYVVTLYLDYRNYDGPNGANGEIGCYVNGNLIGTQSTTSRWFADNTSTLIGHRSNARWHNGSASGTSDYFTGEVYEVQATNTLPTNLDGFTEHHQELINKWGK